MYLQTLQACTAPVKNLLSYSHRSHWCGGSVVEGITRRKGPLRYISFYLCVHVQPNGHVFSGLSLNVRLLQRRQSKSLHLSFTVVCSCCTQSQCSKSLPPLTVSSVQHLPSCWENNFYFGDIINTWMPFNSKSLPWATNECANFSRCE